MPDTYTVRFTGAADRDFSALSSRDRQRVYVRVQALSEQPRPPGARAVRGRRGYLRIRVGDYRVIYTVNDQARAVTVVVIGWRDDVYERFRNR